MKINKEQQSLIVSAILFVLFSTLLLSLDVLVSGKSLSLQLNTGPKLFPRWILILAIVFTGIEIFASIRTIVKKRHDDAKMSVAENSVEEDIVAMDQEKSTIKILALIVLDVTVSIFIMQYIGFIFAAIFLLVTSMFIVGKRDLKTLIVAPAIIFLVVFIFFAKLLSVPFPRGVGIFAEISRIFY